MESVKITALTVAAAILYGIAHDMVTAHRCVEYFTIGHVEVVDSESPIVMALLWGVLATWWFGLIGGLILAWAARQGTHPKLTARDLIRPIATCLAVMAVASLLAGIAGHVAASRGALVLLNPLADRVPEAAHVAFLSNLWAHTAAYWVGAIAILVLAWKTRRRRVRMNAHDAAITSPDAAA